MRVLVFSLACLGLMSGCSFLEPDKKLIRRQIQLYQAALSGGKFKDAAKYHAKKFVWLKGDKKKTGNATRAFLMSIKEINNRTEVILHVDGIRKLDKDTYIATGMCQVRGRTASSVENTKWDFSMTWIRADSGWKLKEFKEKTERDFNRAR